MGIPWPVGVPNCPNQDGYQEQEPQNTLVEQFEQGRPQTRLLSTANGTLVTFSFTFTREEKVLFRNWYRDVLGYGSLAFETQDFAGDQQLYDHKFTSVPQYTTQGNVFNVTFNAVRFD